MVQLTKIRIFVSNFVNVLRREANFTDLKPVSRGQENKLKTMSRQG